MTAFVHRGQTHRYTQKYAPLQIQIRNMYGYIYIGMCARATHIVWPFSYLPLSKATPDFQRLINGGAHITNLGFGWEATYMYIYKHMYKVHIYREAYLNEVGWDKEERSLSSTVREKVSQRYLFPIGNPLSFRSESPSQILFPGYTTCIPLQILTMHSTDSVLIVDVFLPTNTSGIEDT